MERVPLRLPPHLDRGEDGTCLRARLRGDCSDSLASHDRHLDALHAARPHPADIRSEVHSQGPDDGRSEVTSGLEAYQSSLTGLWLLADSSRASATFKASRPSRGPTDGSLPSSTQVTKWSIALLRAPSSVSTTTTGRRERSRTPTPPPPPVPSVST